MRWPASAKASLNKMRMWATSLSPELPTPDELPVKPPVSSPSAVTLVQRWQPKINWQECAHRLGYALGMAFQIQDDNLDYDGEAVLLGKEIVWDLKNGIPTLPLLLALQEKRKPVPPSFIRISMNRSCRSQRRTLTPSFPWWITIEVLKKPKKSSSSIASGLSVILKLWIP